MQIVKGAFGSQEEGRLCLGDVYVVPAWRGEWVHSMGWREAVPSPLASGHLRTAVQEYKSSGQKGVPMNDIMT